MFLWINPIPGMLSMSIQVMLIGSPGIETLESYEGLACPSWSLTWNQYLFPCHVMHHQSQGVWHPELTPFLIKADETTFQKRSLMRNSVHPCQKNSVKSPELLLYKLCHCWWTQSLWAGAKPQARVFSCGTVSKSWVVPWIPLFDTHHKHVQEIKPSPLGCYADCLHINCAY
jgi:hypothetical protein